MNSLLHRSDGLDIDEYTYVQTEQY